jgi:hypothetical protein
MHPGQMSQGLDWVEKYSALLDLQLRFLAANSARVEHVGALRRDARAHATRKLSLPVSMAARESRAQGMRVLCRVARLQPRLLTAPRIWRTMVKLALGPRILSLLRELRSTRRFDDR